MLMSRKKKFFALFFVKHGFVSLPYLITAIKVILIGLVQIPFNKANCSSTSSLGIQVTLHPKNLPTFELFHILSPSKWHQT